MRQGDKNVSTGQRSYASNGRRRFLREALIDLIEEQGFDALRVGEITERAMVSRATFYRIYQDKYDLVEDLRGAIKRYSIQSLNQAQSIRPGFGDASLSTLRNTNVCTERCLAKKGAPGSF